MKALARAKAEKAARDGKPRPPSVSAGKKQSKPSAINRPKQTKTKTPASSQVFDLFFPRSRYLDHAACCLSELPGQAIVAEDLQDLHWTALDGLQCARMSGNAPPSQQNQWKIRYKIWQICDNFWKFYVIFSTGSKMPPDTQIGQNLSKLGKFIAKMSGAFSWPSGASTPPNLRNVKKLRTFVG